MNRLSLAKMLSEKAIKDFKQIWKEEFDEEIPDSVAVVRAVSLLTLLNIIYRPIKKQWLTDNKPNNQQEKQ